MTTEQLRRPVDELASTYGDEAVAMELAMEERMVTLGRDQVRKQIAKAREAGNESGTGYGKTLIAMSVDTISAAIAEFIDGVNSSRAGKRHSAIKYLAQVDADVAAYIAMRCVVDSLTGKKQLLQRVAINIGSRIEDEARFAVFEEENKKMFNRAAEKAKAGTMYHRKKNTMAGYERRFVEAEWTSWPEQDRFHIGMKLIEMVQGTDLITIGEEITTRRDTKKIIEPTPKLLQWIEREVSKSELLTPAHMPMVVEPLPWTDPFNGGYFTQEAQGRNSLVKTRNMNYLTEMADNAENMPAVYASINALQSTKWSINRRLQETAEALWQEAQVCDVMPSREDVSHVQCPCCGVSVPLPSLNTRGSTEHECFEDAEVLRQWKKLAYETHSMNVSLRSKRMTTAKTLKIADMLKDFDAIYFPYQLDFRGRVYAIPSFNPQGADLTKGLIRFAEGKAIEDGVAAGWLAIHGSNVYGFDKASLEDRIQWVEDHASMIVACAEDPFSHRDWQAADKPWQFLSFCFEWAEFLEVGYGFVSHLPVALDGSCSGIQHFSAMLKDTVGGEAVNLLPQEKPADIYQAVCDKVIEKLTIDAGGLGSTIAQGTTIASPIAPLLEENNSEGEKAIEKTIVGTEGSSDLSVEEMAAGWLALSPNRKTTKRQVMTLPYGSTRYSCREYTEVWLRERTRELGYMPWPKEASFKATQYMSDLIWDSIGEVVVAARSAMDWLQSCAKVVAKEELPVYWTTPSGFPVMQKYQNFSSRRVKTKLGEAVVKLSLQQEEDTIDKRRMANAISPNFVHSLDATHLVMSTELAVNNGIDSFAMIHDSFGTHAADTAMLAACLREAFVELYHDKDVLGDFRNQIMRQVDPDNQKHIKPVPPKGDLDVSVVRNSDFFFA